MTHEDYSNAANEENQNNSQSNEEAGSTYSAEQSRIDLLESEVAGYREQEWNKYVKYFKDDEYSTDFAFLQNRADEFTFSENGKNLTPAQLKNNLDKLKPYIEAEVFGVLENRSKKQSSVFNHSDSKRAIPFKSNQKTSFAEIFNIFDN